MHLESLRKKTVEEEYLKALRDRADYKSKEYKAELREHFRKIASRRRERKPLNSGHRYDFSNGVEYLPELFFNQDREFAIVSAAVRDAILDEGLTFWRFDPVLEIEP